MNGAFIIDKPSGISSFDVIRQLRRDIQEKKMGYLGTLDPLASGVLVIFVGKATQLIPYCQELKKTYEVGLELGKESDTYDITGVIEEKEELRLPSTEVFSEALHHYIGDQWQTQPAFSALKFQGKRAYEHAREGKEIDLGKRQVNIEEITILSQNPPHYELKIVCSSGTYIRSFVHELGQYLGTSAVMSSLRRVSVGLFRIEDALPPNQLVREQCLSPEVIIDQYIDWKGRASGDRAFLLRKFHPDKIHQGTNQ